MTDQSSSNENQEGQQVQIHVAPDLEYSYRDVVNIHVGAGDVVLEFGNHHRVMPGNVTISNRVVMTFANAYELQQKLQQALLEAQKQMQLQMQDQ